ncbi:hypothetical protein [Okeania sp. SIO2B3]|uniref:hypothetical protein n=1 Tax=Okeania sp. SIO2B3 TaxID=2607784 RepID=UPI0013BEC2CD|nr:hypothetical protein [Okeania sp. SIO2B3]NET45258.1 hypothetical protein [Okeania sp. SIO2B3]
MAIVENEFFDNLKINFIEEGRRKKEKGRKKNIALPEFSAFDISLLFFRLL